MNQKIGGENDVLQKNHNYYGEMSGKRLFNFAMYAFGDLDLS